MFRSIGVALAWAFLAKISSCLHQNSEDVVISSDGQVHVNASPPESQTRDDLIAEGAQIGAGMCATFEKINDEVAAGKEENERHYADDEEEPQDDDEDEVLDGIDSLEKRAAQMDAEATKEAEEAGGDMFDSIFDDDDDEDVDAEDDNSTEVGDHSDLDAEFASLLRSFYGGEADEAQFSNATEDVDDGLESCAHPITPDEEQHLQCPPGEYLGHTTEFAKQKRLKRLRKALCLAKARGYRRGVDPENQHYLHRGYMTYESSAWPKPFKCRTLPDRDWHLRNSNNKRYRPDQSPEFYRKEVSHRHNMEFHKSWKVASTSFPDYLRCQYPGKWTTPFSTKMVRPGTMVFAAVREPIARFVSAANELLERSINKFCPNGPCTSTDGFEYGKGPGTTHDKFMHQTHWYAPVSSDHGGYTASKLRKLVRSMVKDTVCNYYTYAVEHTSTQTNFITQNAGKAAHIQRIIKLENVDAGLEKMRQARSPGNKMCKLGHKNVKSCKPNQSRVPSEVAFLNMLHHQPELVKELCLVYAMDFICLDYQLPKVCTGMF